MLILRGLLFTLAILLTFIAGLAGISILVAELTGSQFYNYSQGTVIQVHSDPQQGSVATVRFVTREHTTVDFEMANAFPVYHVGSKLPVKYKPGEPSEAYNASFAANGLLGLGLLWFATLCFTLLIGAVMFRRYIWRQVAITIHMQRRR